ncbi:MAG: TRAP transporter substrate-binding protein [Lachnospiraceae bacterium]|nr:TRAP transporter substrate-binding protein [Lachnospiraceae bacterium]
MKKLRRALVLMLCLAMMASLAACGSSSSSSSDTTAAETEAAETEATDETAGDEDEESEAADSSDGAAVEINTDNIGEYSWFLGMDSSEDTVTYLYAEKFAELVNEYSGGKMTITLQPNATLGTDAGMFESIQTQDGVNFVVQTTAPQVNYLPELAVFDAACVYSDIEDVRKALDNEDFMAEIEAIYSSGGYKLLGYADQNFRVLSCNTEVTTLSDLSGMKIRTMENNNHISFWSDCGANPTPMSFSEVYTSLQNGTIDGQENPYEVIVSNALYEVQDYVIVTNHLPHILSLVTGSLLYDNLNEDEQAVLEQAVEEAKAYAREQADARVEDRLATIEASGTTVVEFSQSLFDEMQEAAQDEWETVKAASGEDLFNAYIQYAE